MRNNAQDPDLPRRFGDRGYRALSAAATAATASAATNGDVPGWIDGSDRHDLSDPAATAATTAAGAPFRRTRLTFKEAGANAPASSFCKSGGPGWRAVKRRRSR